MEFVVNLTEWHSQDMTDDRFSKDGPQASDHNIEQLRQASSVNPKVHLLEVNTTLLL